MSSVISSKNTKSLSSFPSSSSSSKGSQEKNSNFKLFNTIPKVITQEVISYLFPEDLLSLTQTNKELKSIADGNQSWEPFLKQSFLSDDQAQKPGKTFKSGMMKDCFKTNLLARKERFYPCDRQGLNALQKKKINTSHPALMKYIKVGRISLNAAFLASVGASWSKSPGLQMLSLPAVQEHIDKGRFGNMAISAGLNYLTLNGELKSPDFFHVGNRGIMGHPLKKFLNDPIMNLLFKSNVFTLEDINVVMDTNILNQELHVSLLKNETIFTGLIDKKVTIQEIFKLDITSFDYDTFVQNQEQFKQSKITLAKAGRRE